MPQEIITQAVQHANPAGISLSFQTLFNIAIGVLGFVGGLSVNRLFNRLDKLDAHDESLSKEIKDLSVTLPTNYVMKEDLQRLADAIFIKLDNIESKIDRKQDKSGT